MATGDKIYLADKETLDLVKRETEQISVNLEANTERVLNAVESSAIQPSKYKEYLTVSELSKIRYGAIAVGDTSRNAKLEITGSGEFYCLMHRSSTFLGEITGIDYISMRLDNVDVYSSTFSHASSDNYGFITPAAMTTGLNTLSVLVPGGGSLGFTANKSIAINPLAAVNNLVYYPKPIRFESNIQLYGYLSSTNGLVSGGTMYYMYKLD